MVLRKWLNSFVSRQFPGHQKPGARRAKLNQSRHVGQPAAMQLELLEVRQLLTAPTDQTAPTPVFSTSLSTPTNASTLPITVNFGEAVTGLTLSDFTITNGTASNLTGSGSTYSIDVTPTADGVVTINMPQHAVDDLAGNKSKAATALSITVDRSAPATPVVSSPNSSILTNAANVTITGTAEAGSLVRLYRDADSSGTVSNGDTLVNSQQLVTGQTAFSISAALTANSTNRLVVTATDAAGNVSAARAVPTITQDSIAPTPSIAISTSQYTNAASVAVAVSFTESVVGFTSGDVSVGNGTVSNFVAVDGSHYTFNVAPNGDGTVTINVAAGAASDAAGNSSNAATQASFVSDRTAPVITVTPSAAKNANGWNNTDVTVSYSVVEANVDAGASDSSTDVLTASGTASATVTDLAGNSTTVDYSTLIDKIAPTLAAFRDLAANANGWNNSDVTVTFESSDNLSGGFTTPAAQVFGEGADQTASATVTDLAGNSTSVSIEHINVDKTAPTLNAIRSAAANSNGWNNTDVTVTFAASDALSGGVSSPAAQSFGEGFDQSASATVTDLAGNSTSVSIQHINIDKTAPTLTATRDIAANANGWNSSDVTVTFEAGDTLSGGVSSPAAQLFGEGFDQTASATVTDLAGNSTSVSIEHIRVDKTAPVITVTPSVTKNANGWNNSDVTVSYSVVEINVDASASDSADDVLTESGSVGATVTDLAGNTNSVSYSTLIDKVAPTLTATRDIAANENGWNNSDVTVTFEASDDLSGGVSSPDAQVFGEGSHQTATATVTDLAGNSTTVSIEHINVDKTAPTLTAARDSAANENGWNNNDVTVSFEAIDTLSGGVSSPDAQVFGEGSHQTATATVTDLAGNSTTVSIEHINVDKTAPTLTATRDIVANANGWNKSDVTVSFESSDDLSGGFSNPEAQVFGEGVDQTATATVTDLAGNSTTASIEHINVDKTAPALIVVRDIAANENGWNNSDVTVSFEASDDLSGGVSNPTAQVFGEGFDQTASAAVTDLAGNTTTVVEHINVDKTAPTLTAARDIAANENGWNNSDVTVSFEAGDALSGGVTSPAAQVFGEGLDQTASATVTDLAGNSTTVSIEHINVDKTAPTLTAARNVDANENGWNNSDVTVSFEASDALSGGVSNPDSQVFGEGADQTATATVTDLAGNTTSVSIEHINVDKTAPTLTAARDIAANENGWNKGDVTVTFEASDALSGVSVPDAQVFGEGFDQTATATVTDLAGNSATVSIEHINVDKTAPTLTAARDIAANENGWNNSDVTVSFEASDALSGGVSNPDSQVFGEGFDQTATASVTDLAGNTTTIQFEHINVDKTAPTLTASRDIDANENGWNNGDVAVSFEASDALSGVAGNPASQVFGEGFNQTATATVTDLAGNSSNVSLEQINIDKTAPTLTAARDIAANENGWNNSDVTVSFEASDALSGVAGNPASQVFGEGFDQTATANVTDLAGNSTTVSIEHINVDKTAPAITVVAAPTAGQEASALHFEVLVSDLSGTSSTSWDISGGPLTIGSSDSSSLDVTPLDNGSYEVVYSVTDAAGNSSSVTLDVDVSNIAPTAGYDEIGLTGEEGDDSVSLIYEDDVLEGEGLLDNDTDPAGANDLLSVSGADESSAAGAAVTVYEDGSFEYDPTNSEEIQALNAGDVLLDTFQYQITDGDGGTSDATVTVEVHGVNDAPSIDDTSVVKLTNIDANDRYDRGVDIQDFAVDRIDDADSNYSVGLAVFGFARGTTNGNWQFSTNDGHTWTTLSTIGEGHALHLAADGHTRVRLLPDGSHTGTARLTVRAWDGSNGVANGAFAAIGGTGGTSAYSTQSLSVRQAVLSAANDTTIAVADTYWTDAHGAIHGNVLDNDIDPDTALPNGVAVRVTSRPDFGTLTAQRNGGFHYQANSEMFAAMGEGDLELDGFTYSVTDGTRTSNIAAVSFLLAGVNDAPTATTTIGDQVATEDQHFFVGLPGGLFQDVDTGDSLTITATQANGSALPSWLSFNAGHRTLTGTPADADVGHLTIRLTATDTHGASASVDFGLQVANVETTPQVGHAIGDATAHEDEFFSGNINGDGPAFTDADSAETLTVTATLSNGSALPAWLSFNGSTLSGTPSNDDVGDYSILFTATDSAGLTATQTGTLHVTNVNDAPTASTLDDVSVSEGQTLEVTLPANLFHDVDAGDHLNLSVSDDHGNALPSFFAFNASTGTLTASPDFSSAGTYGVVVTATDSSGATASAGFTVTVIDSRLKIHVTGHVDNPNEAWSLFVDTQGLLHITRNGVDEITPVSLNEVFSVTLDAGDGNDTVALAASLNGAADEHNGDGDHHEHDDGSGLFINLGAGNDSVDASLLTFRVVVHGGDGNDLILGGSAGDTIFGDAGNDTLNGSGGNDVVLGGDGNDTLRGGAGSDSLDGGADNDLLVGQGGGDLLLGGTGNDTVNGGVGNDSMLGNDGDDSMIGGTGNDIVIGGTGNDTLLGNEGADTLIGGTGADSLSGGNSLLDVGLGGEGGSTNRGGAGAPDVGDSLAADIETINETFDTKFSWELTVLIVT